MQVFYNNGWVLEWIPHWLGAIPNPIFHYKKPYMVHFQNTQKSPKKNLRFTRKQQIKREIFTKHPQVNFIWLGPFFGPNPLSLRLLITCLLTVIDLTEGNNQNQSLGTPFKVSSFNPFSIIFLFFFSILILLLCLVYV